MSTSDVRRACPPCVGVTTLRGGAGEAHQAHQLEVSSVTSDNTFRIHLEIGTEEAGTILSVRVSVKQINDLSSIGRFT